MMERTVIVGTKDGSLLVTREARVGIPGNARQRRISERRGVEESWRTTDRVIARDLSGLPTRAKGWMPMDPSPQLESSIAADNVAVAAQYVSKSEEIVSTIESAAANFKIAPMRELRVLFVEVE